MSSVRTMLAAAAVVAIASTLPVRASDPPPLPAVAMPAAVKPTAPNQQPTRIWTPGPPRTPLTRAELDGFTLSGALYSDLARSSEVGDAETFGGATDSSSNLSVESLSGGPIRVTNDAYLDVEPSTTATTVFGTQYSVSAWIKYGPPQKYASIYYAYTTNFSSFTTGQLSIPAGYTRSADPQTAVNPYTGGIAGKRVYVAGLLHNGNFTDISAIGVWRTDTGGATWSGPTIVEMRSNHYLLDRPAIAVSTHPNTLGYVYVAYVSVNEYDRTQNALVVERSTDGGLSFGTPVVISIGRVTAPDLVVDSNTGKLYVFWLDNTNQRIVVASSTDYGISFGWYEQVTGPYYLGPTIYPGVPAQTCALARFHYQSGRVIVTWMGYSAETGSMEVYYSYKPCTSNCNAWGWRNAIQVNDNSTNDQFMPAIDFNSAGNVVIAFYDRRDDPQNKKYHEYYAYLNVDGVRLEPNTRITSSQSDPTLISTVAGADAFFIGDYQSLWDWSYSFGERAVPAFVTVPGPDNGEVNLARIVY